jgi:NADPH:quinone reductase-like Zn-dependent oxidoreductase
VKAVVYDAYGPPPADTHLRSGRPFFQRFQSGLRRPKRRILGHELAGEIAAAGPDVAELGVVGDRVFDGLRNVALRLLHKRVGSRKVVFDLPPRYRKEDVVFLKGLLEAGEYRPVVDRTYPLEDVVEASRYVETEQKTGNVVLALNGGPAR